jgi:hypothetical protein
MLGVAAGAVALLVTVSSLSYFGIMGVLLYKLAVEGPETRRVLSGPLLPAFLQNLGIPAAVIGFTLQSTGAVLIASLMIATGMLITSEKSVSLHPTIEAPMLALALITLSAVGALQFVF